MVETSNYEGARRDPGKDLACFLLRIAISRMQESIYYLDDMNKTMQQFYVRMRTDVDPQLRNPDDFDVPEGINFTVIKPSMNDILRKLDTIHNFTCRE